MEPYTKSEAQILGPPPGWNAANTSTTLYLHQQSQVSAGAHFPHFQSDDDELFRQACQSLLRNHTANAAPSHITPQSGSSSASEAAAGPEDSAMLQPCWRPAAGGAKLRSPAPRTQPGAPASRKAGKKQPESGASPSSKRSQRQINLKLIEAGKQLQGLTERHCMAEAENARLKMLNKNLSACIEHSDFQQRMSDIVHKSPRSPRPLPPSCSQVSFAELPPSSGWDASWIARIQGLAPQDFVVLRRQWVQQSAVLLPQAMAYGPGSDAYGALHALHNRHLDLVRALVTLAPSVWLESSQYDMDTLQLVQTPSAEWIRDLLTRMAPPEVLDMLRHIGRDYHCTAGALDRQYRSLLQRYNGLAHRMNLQQLEPAGDDDDGVVGAGAGLGSGFVARSSHQSVMDRPKLDRSAGYVETLEQLDETAKLLQANTSKQKHALLKFFSTCNHGFDPKRIGMLLMLYPLSCTSVDFLPGLLLGDAVVPSDPSLRAPGRR